MSPERRASTSGASPRDRPRSSRRLVPWLLSAAVLAAAGAAFVMARARAERRFREDLATARQQIDAGHFARARSRLAQLAAERPDEGEVLYWLGHCEAAAGRVEAALALWSRVAPDSPWVARSALEYAGAAIRMGRLAAAERVLRRALGRPGPERPNIRHLIVVLMGQQGRGDEARRFLEDRWEADRSAGVDDRIALIRDHMGLDLEPFPLEWNLALLGGSPEPDDDEDRRAVSLARSYLAVRSGDFEAARIELRSSLRRWPDDPIVWKSWLDWAVAADRMAAALEALDHLPARTLDEARILELRAWFARHRGDHAEEIRTLEHLLTVSTGRTPALTRLAELHSGAIGAIVSIRRKESELDNALDRYNRLYKEGRLLEHLLELLNLSERLGRRFEARAFRALIDRRDGRRGAGPAPKQDARPEPSGTLAQALADVLPPRPWPEEASAPSDPHHGPIPRFEDAAASAGLSAFVQDNGESSIHQLPEMASGGVGLLDYDGDGDLDVYAVQGGAFPPRPEATAQGDRLFRNRGDGTFEDATRLAGIDRMPGGYGFGVAVGDVDNDGHPDLFVTRWRAYSLYRNRGDGRFVDVTRAAGLDGDRDWPTSSAFADLDGDGDLDLYVCHYGAWGTRDPRVCKDPSGSIVVVCDPRVIDSTPDHVFRNDGGRFVDVTEESGFLDLDGRGLGVVAADLDEDGRIDLFVANDSTANQLFRNLGGFRFQEVAYAAGVAANAGGGYQAGMGVAHGDLDGDGRLDLAVTNYYGESTTFFHNLGEGVFVDHTSAIGLAAPSRHRLGFGVAILDVNDDGWMDLLTANGHVSDQRPLYPYAMTPQLYLGSRSGRLDDVTSRAGPPFEQGYVGRGLAVGDLDDDGRLDAVMVAQNGPLVYLRNRGGDGDGHFIAFRLEGAASNRDGVGAVVTVTAGGRPRVATRFGGGSYLSAADPRIHFGLGDRDRIESVEVRWPSGRVDRHRDLLADRLYLLREGSPKPLPPVGSPLRRR